MSWKIGPILKSLADRRPIFHSEADFQHALAWEIHLVHPEVEVRLEVPFEQDDEKSRRRHGKKHRRRYVDLVCIGPRTETWLELKYNTLKPIRGPIIVGREQFRIENQRAVDNVRTAFWRDVARVEHLCRERGRRARGFAIILTNNPALCRDRMGGTPAKDRELRLVQGKRVKGPLWHKKQTRGDNPKRGYPIDVRGVYTINWKTFHNFKQDPHGEFRYLVLEANNGT